MSWLRAWLVPTRGLEPVTLSTYSTSGSAIGNSIARSVTSRVRSMVAPSGSSSSTVKYPWSSCGMKLSGTRRFMTQMPTRTMPKAANMRRERVSAFTIIRP